MKKLGQTAVSFFDFHVQIYLQKKKILFRRLLQTVKSIKQNNWQEYVKQLKTMITVYRSF